ncbi:hypothetical protein [Variovorax sp. YR216]|uniref:hypothetical protein n=1 Tax=Variovorax sp. YR216 TaxID=1882828 RepID=UPI00089C074A|nr:hypothetical protein [Variovorax sp. YR216]SEB19807.1 hypothetical protein SAMN05444680_1134 [Variovorax sp. YR216]
MTPTKIPEDFPRDPRPGAVPGAQPKLLLRKVDDAFVSGWTDEELALRYVVCADLVTQLSRYARRKLEANPAWDRAELERRMAVGIRAKPWGFTEPEIDWMVRRACKGI